MKQRFFHRKIVDLNPGDLGVGREELTKQTIKLDLWGDVLDSVGHDQGDDTSHFPKTVPVYICHPDMQFTICPGSDNKLCDLPRRKG